MHLRSCRLPDALEHRGWKPAALERKGRKGCRRSGGFQEGRRTGRGLLPRKAGAGHRRADIPPGFWVKRAVPPVPHALWGTWMAHGGQCSCVYTRRETQTLGRRAQGCSFSAPCSSRPDSPYLDSETFWNRTLLFPISALLMFLAPEGPTHLPRGPRLVNPAPTPRGKPFLSFTDCHLLTAS